MKNNLWRWVLLFPLSIVAYGVVYLLMVLFCAFIAPILNMFAPEYSGTFFMDLIALGFLPPIATISLCSMIVPPFKRYIARCIISGMLILFYAVFLIYVIIYPNDMMFRDITVSVTTIITSVVVYFISKKEE